MLQLETILAGIDLHDETPRVIEAARAMSTVVDGSRLFAVHAVPPLSVAAQRMLMPMSCYGDDFDALRAELMGTARQTMLDRFGEDLKPLAGRFSVAAGLAAPAVTEAAVGIGPDLLVLGSSSAKHPTPGEVGPSALRLAATISAPTLIVRPSPAPIRFNAILAALDLADGAPSVLQAAIELANAMDGGVMATHVVPSARSLDLAGVLSRKGEDRLENKVRDSAIKLFRQTAGAMQIRFPLRESLPERVGDPRIEYGDPGPRLVEVADETGADLIVLSRCRVDESSGTRLGRVAEYVLRHSRAHVLVLPPERIAVAESA